MAARKSLDSIHFSQPKRRKSEALEDFRRTAFKQATRIESNAAPTPSPPSSVMPKGANESDLLESEIVKALLEERNMPADFFSASTSLSPIDDDDRAQEILNEVHNEHSNRPRSSYGSTVSLSQNSPDKYLDDPLEEHGEEFDEVEETNHSLPLRLLNTADKRNGVRSMKSIEDYDNSASDIEEAQTVPSKPIRSMQVMKRQPKSTKYVVDSDEENEEKNPRPITRQVPPAKEKRRRAQDMDLTDDGEEEHGPPKKQVKHAPKKNKKMKSMTPVVDSEEGESPPKRQMRQRTVAQQFPFQTDKVRHKMSRQTGEAADDSDVEYEVRATQRRTQAKGKTNKTRPSPISPAKKARNAAGQFSADKTASPSPAATSTTSGTPEISKEHIYRNTTLMIWYDGDDDGPNAWTLAECPSLTALFEYVDRTWGKIYNKVTTKLVGELPWKTSNKRVVMYTGWDSSYAHLIREIEKAPVWQEQGETAMEVKLVATLANAPR